MRQVWYEVLDNIGVRQGVDLHLLGGVGRNSAQASQSVGTVDVHGARATDTFSATSSEGKGRVDFVLDSHEGIEHHGSGFVEVESVGLHPWLLGRRVGIPSVHLEGLQTTVVGTLGVGIDGGITN